MSRQPSLHLGVLVGSVIVGDEVDDLAERCLGLDGVQETDELLMAVALHTAADQPCLRARRGRQTARSCRTACNHVSWSRLAPSSSANPAGFGRAPGFATSRRPTARWRAPADRYRGP